MLLRAGDTSGFTPASRPAVPPSRRGSGAVT